jgi:DNA invertase Pin-like site-specific DNA recombinase
MRVRPQFEAALALAREIKAHAPHGLVLEMLAGPLPGVYDPTGPGRILFAFFAALAETERDNIRKGTLEGLDAAAAPAAKPSSRSSPT